MFTKYDYKDSFDSLIFYAKQSHNIQSLRPIEIGHPQDLRISSFHAIPWTSSPRICLCYVEAPIPLNLCVDEKQPPKTSLEVKSAFFSLGP